MATATVWHQAAPSESLAPSSLTSKNVIDFPSAERQSEQVSLQRLGMVACVGSDIADRRPIACASEQSPYYPRKLLSKYNLAVHREGIRRRALLANEATPMEAHVADDDFATWYQQYNHHGGPLRLDVRNRMGDIGDARGMLDALVWLSKGDAYDARMAEIAATNELEMATNPLVRWALTPEQAKKLPPDDAAERIRILRIHALLRPNSARKYGIEPRHDQYMHVAVHESAETQDIVNKTRLVYADGYCKERGFITEDAIDPETGFVVDDIDHSRGDDTEYHLAYNPAEQQKMATMRILSIPAGGTIKDLPSYKLCEDALYPKWRNHLERLPAASVKDVSAMAKTEACGRDGTPVYEIIRKTVHDAIGKQQEWVFVIVSRTREMLIHKLTPENLQQIGEPVRIDDPRVAEGLTLTPARLCPDTFIDNIRYGYEAALRAPVTERDPKKIQRLEESFLFYTDGLPPEKMSKESTALRQRLQRAREAA